MTTVLVLTGCVFHLLINAFKVFSFEVYRLLKYVFVSKPLNSHT